MSNIVWATASNTWQTASIWNFWNEDTQQIEPYGRSPQNGDTVYLNGFTVTSTSNINIGNGLITNDANDTYGIIAGGQLTMNLRGWTITANLFAKQGRLIDSNTTQQTALESIIGNVENDDGYVIYYSGSYAGSWARNININGNIHLRNQDMNYYVYQNLTSFPTVSNVTITGNIVIDNPSKRILANRNVGGTVSVGGNMTGGKISDTINNFVLGGKLTQTAQQANITTATFSNEVEILDGAYLSGTTVNLNDNLIIHDGSYLAFTTVNFNKVDGFVKIGHNSRFSATTHNFTGRKIEYYDDSFGVCGITVGVYSMFNPQNSDFQWVNLSEPRTSKFVILSDYDVNNREQYPTESEVKEGVEYVWGELVGTYQQPPESVVLKDYVYDTITAEENDIATYNLTRYIYANYGTLHWFELKTTTTDIVTDPTLQSIDIDGDTVVADTDYVAEYNDACYQWDGSVWGSITTNNIGTVKTNIVTNPTETTLCTKKGTLETSNLPQTTLDRMANTLTVDILQQILDAHLNG